MMGIGLLATRLRVATTLVVMAVFVVAVGAGCKDEPIRSTGDQPEAHDCSFSTTGRLYDYRTASCVAPEEPTFQRLFFFNHLIALRDAGNEPTRFRVVLARPTLPAEMLQILAEAHPTRVVNMSFHFPEAPSGGFTATAVLPVGAPDAAIEEAEAALVAKYSSDLQAPTDQLRHQVAAHLPRAFAEDAFTLVGFEVVAAPSSMMSSWSAWDEAVSRVLPVLVEDQPQNSPILDPDRRRRE